MTHNGDFVTYGRWEEADEAVRDRLTVVERRAEELRGAEAEHDSLATRITILEQAAKSETEGNRARSGHIWLVLAGVISGFILPLITSTIVTLFHLSHLHL